MHPHYEEQEPFQIRREKLEAIQKLSIDPYPHSFSPTHSLDRVAGWPDPLGDSEEGANRRGPHCRLAGRLTLFRAMGKNAFAHIQEGGISFQLLFNREVTQVQGLPEGEKPLKFIEKSLDLGDVIGVEGYLFTTHRGEITLFVHELTLLAKALLPLPDKHSGLQDKGTRYRKRWLDLISHPETLDKFRLRSRMVQAIRHYLEDSQFLEVETPILQSLYGGAEAKPFETTLEALKQSMYLRISLEIPLKKLMVGGIPRLFEMGKVFRNEGIDATHNPEFSLLEAYAAYWDYREVLRFVEGLFAHVAKTLTGSTTLMVRKDEESEPLAIDLSPPWKSMTMLEAIAEYGSLSVEGKSDRQLIGHLEGTKHEGKEMPRGLLIAALFETYAEPHLIQPHHILDHPIETTPLCKPHRNPEKKEEGLVERFESFILGREMCNAYSELNDPLLQRDLLTQQQKKKEAGEEEAHPLDEEFLEALAQGMPPVGGFGIGIDRMAMLFCDLLSIRDVLYFPWMKE
ncbi:MAG: lysine--tRNA ligase [Chlamydiota bacterium]|nr:lysine--tRNA ligase [Chlamydiota bacterium]